MFKKVADAELNAIVAPAEQVTLAECPIGLFLSADGELCLKTEYGNNEGRIDAYIVRSGEFFWGDAPQTIANQRRQMVTPITVDITAAELRRVREVLLLWQVWLDATPTRPTEDHDG